MRVNAACFIMLIFFVTFVTVEQWIGRRPASMLPSSD